MPRREDYGWGWAGRMLLNPRARRAKLGAKGAAKALQSNAAEGGLRLGVGGSDVTKPSRRQSRTGAVADTGADTVICGRSGLMPRFRHEYPQDTDTVFALITNPDALTKRCEALGERDVKVEVSEEAGTTKIRIAREVEQELPGFAKRLFKPTNVLVEKEEWQSSGDRKTAKGHLKIVGTGATFDSTITLSPQGAGCVYEIDFKVTAKAPLIRKKLEAFIGETALESLRKQHEHYASVLG